MLEVRKGTAVFKLYKFKQSLLFRGELEMVKENLQLIIQRLQ
jgi:hypothetical protein